MTDVGTVRDWESIALIDRLYWRDIVAFNSLVAACRRRNMTLIQRVRQRIDELKKEKHDRIRNGAPMVDVRDGYYCWLSVGEGCADDLPHVDAEPDVQPASHYRGNFRRAGASEH